MVLPLQIVALYLLGIFGWVLISEFMTGIYQQTLASIIILVANPTHSYPTAIKILVGRRMIGTL
jgi:hypothetical protein